MIPGGTHVYMYKLVSNGDTLFNFNKDILKVVGTDKKANFL